jgi:MinD-like ATPase involved in chromosome partitioning or flagellar assembly
VTEPTPAALGDAVRARALADELDATLVGVVLNRTSDGTPTDVVSRQFGAPVTPVPEDDRVAAAQASGRPVRTVAPDSAAATAFADLADRVTRTATRFARQRNGHGPGTDGGTGNGAVM